MHEGPVVAGVDGSPESLQALRKAAELASLVHEFARSLVVVRGELTAVGPERSR